MKRVHFQVLVDIFNCQQILAKISFVIFDIVVKKNKSNWFNVALLVTREVPLIWDSLIDMFLSNLNAEIVACILLFRKSWHEPDLENTSKYGFSPDLGGKNDGVLSMRMQVILDSSFARPGSAPIRGGKKGEFRDWTIADKARQDVLRSSTVRYRPTIPDFVADLSEFTYRTLADK